MTQTQECTGIGGIEGGSVVGGFVLTSPACENTSTCVIHEDKRESNKRVFKA